MAAVVAHAEEKANAAAAGHLDNENGEARHDGNDSRQHAAPNRPLVPPVASFIFGIDSERFSDCNLVFTGKDSSQASHNDEGSLESSTSIRASRIVLAAHSAFFRSLFSQQFRDSTSEHVELRVPKHQIDACLQLVRCIHAGITEESLAGRSEEELLALVVVGDRFQCTTAIEGSITCLQRNLNLGLCEQLLKLPVAVKKLTCFAGVQKTIEKFLLTHYGDLDAAEDADLARFSGELLAILLRSDKLKLRSENTTFIVACRWFMSKHRSRADLEPTTRDDNAQGAVRRVLTTFRYAQFSANFFMDVVRTFRWMRHDSLDFTPEEAIQTEMIRRLESLIPSRNREIQIPAFQKHQRTPPHPQPAETLTIACTKRELEQQKVVERVFCKNGYEILLTLNLSEKGNGDKELRMTTWVDTDRALRAHNARDRHRAPFRANLVSTSALVDGDNIREISGEDCYGYPADRTKKHLGGYYYSASWPWQGNDGEIKGSLTVSSLE